MHVMHINAGPKLLYVMLLYTYMQVLRYVHTRMYRAYVCTWTLNGSKFGIGIGHNSAPVLKDIGSLSDNTPPTSREACFYWQVDWKFYIQLATHIFV